MKKILFLLAILPMIVFTACSDDDDSKQKQTSYTLKWNMSESSSLISTDVWLFEYNDKDESVGNNTVDDVQDNYTEVFKANEQAVKVKVQIRMSGGTTSSNRWVQQVYYLTKGGNTDIKIDGETIIGTKEP